MLLSQSLLDTIDAFDHIKKVFIKRKMIERDSLMAKRLDLK